MSVIRICTVVFPPTTPNYCLSIKEFRSRNFSYQLLAKCRITLWSTSLRSRQILSFLSGASAGVEPPDVSQGLSTWPRECISSIISSQWIIIKMAEIQNLPFCPILRSQGRVFISCQTWLLFFKFTGGPAGAGYLKTLKLFIIQEIKTTVQLEYWEAQAASLQRCKFELVPNFYHPQIIDGSDIYKVLITTVEE